MNYYAANLDLVEEMLPGRITEIAKKTGFDIRTVSSILDRLHEGQRARIGYWDPPRCQGSRFTPVWVAGKGPNKRRPSKQARKEHMQQSWNKARDRRMGRAPAAPVATWFAPLELAA